jgi:hypothetical protein
LTAVSPRANRIPRAGAEPLQKKCEVRRKPDSVASGCPDVTAIPLGCLSPDSSVLPTRQLCGATSTLAYLVLLRVEIARFTPPLGLVPSACASGAALEEDSSLLL